MEEKPPFTDNTYCKYCGDPHATEPIAKKTPDEKQRYVHWHCKAGYDEREAKQA